MSASLLHAGTPCGALRQPKAVRPTTCNSRALRHPVLAISKGSKSSPAETKRDVTANAASTVAPPSAKASKQSVLSKEIAADTYKDMVLGREFEEMCAQMYYRGKMFGYGSMRTGGKIHTFCTGLCTCTAARRRCRPASSASSARTTTCARRTATTSTR